MINVNDGASARAALAAGVGPYRHLLGEDPVAYAWCGFPREGVLAIAEDIALVEAALARRCVDGCDVLPLHAGEDLIAGRAEEPQCDDPLGADQAFEALARKART